MYCDVGAFHIDPIQTVRTAVITHAHGDHAMRGSAAYYTAAPGAELLRKRVGYNVKLYGIPYGETFTLGKAQVTFFPAGHMLGSSQVRVEYEGETWCVTGDYKLTPDPTCDPWVTVRCDTLITEATFGHPDFVWPDEDVVFEQIHAWWRARVTQQLPSLIFAYALGKSQRLLARLDRTIAPIQIPEMVEEYNEIYRRAGVHLPKTHLLHPSQAVLQVQQQAIRSTDLDRSQVGAMLIIPPGWRTTLSSDPRLRGGVAITSGWALRPKEDKSQVTNRVFPISDHADWLQLNQAIQATGARRVLIMHGPSEPLASHLIKQGIHAKAFA